MTDIQAAPMRAAPTTLNLTETLGETLRSLPDAWRGAWGGMIAWGVAILAAMVLTDVGPWRGLILAAVVVTGLALQAALLRLRLGLPGNAPAGLQFGRTEARLLGAALLCLLLIFMIASVVGLALLAVAGMAELDAAAIARRDWGAAGEGWKLAVVTLGAAAAVFTVVSLFVRLSLAAPATVARGRMISLDSFIVARGAAWPLFLGLAATATPVVILTLLSANGVLSGAAGAVSWAAVLAGVQAPLTFGFLAGAYRRLDR